MSNYTYELEQLEAGNRSPELMQRIIEKRKKRAEEIVGFYNRYTAKDVPIYHRTVDNPQEINHRLNVDFFSEIIDVKTGYFAGNEIGYKVNKEAEERWKEFKNMNRLADVDSETTKHSSIGGLTVRLMLIDPETGLEYIVIVPSYECVLLGNKGADEAKYGLRFYEVEIEENKKEARVELWEANKVTDYVGQSFSDLKFKKGKENGSEHVFDYCPMWGYINSDEEQGDAEKVIPLIDEYNMVVSDAGGEHEAFRSAILAFFGVEAPGEEEEALDTTKNLTVYFRNDNETKQDAKFITKEIQDAALEHFLDRIESLIYRMSKTPNFADASFGGQQSGVALKHKIQPLENKSASFERKFASANIRMFELLASSWRKRGNTILKPYEVEQIFTRNLPKDLLYEAEVQMKLKGLISDETRVGLFPGVDVEEELARMQAEEEVYMEKLMEQEAAMGGEDDDGKGTTKAGTGKVTS